MKALSSVALSRLPESVTWEVLVVDNNSCDQTREVVEDFIGRYPGRFRYLFESEPGKSRALNRGIAEARGDVLAFMDDDVIVDPRWLQMLTAALLKGMWAGSGGRILAKWNCPRPPWLPENERRAMAPLAVFDLGLEAKRLAEPPFGTNMAFRRNVFEKYGGFRTDLGPQPGSQIRNEDTEFGRRLLGAGEQLWYEPSAIVFHPVQENRLRKQYYLAWWFDKARADILELGPPSHFKLCFGGVPLRLFRRLAVWTVRWILAVRPSRRFSNKLEVWAQAGQIVECYRRARLARTEGSRANRFSKNIAGT